MILENPVLARCCHVRLMTIIGDLWTNHTPTTMEDRPENLLTYSPLMHVDGSLETTQAGTRHRAQDPRMQVREAESH